MFLHLHATVLRVHLLDAILLREPLEHHTAELLLLRRLLLAHCRLYRLLLFVRCLHLRRGRLLLRLALRLGQAILLLLLLEVQPIDELLHLLPPPVVLLLLLGEPLQDAVCLLALRRAHLRRRLLSPRDLRGEACNLRLLLPKPPPLLLARLLAHRQKLRHPRLGVAHFLRLAHELRLVLLANLGDDGVHRLALLEVLFPRRRLHRLLLLHLFLEHQARLAAVRALHRRRLLLQEHRLGALLLRDGMHGGVALRLALANHLLLLLLQSTLEIHLRRSEFLLELAKLGVGFRHLAHAELPSLSVSLLRLKGVDDGFLLGGDASLQLAILARAEERLELRLLRRALARLARAATRVALVERVHDVGEIHALVDAPGRR